MVVVAEAVAVAVVVVVGAVDDDVLPVVDAVDAVDAVAADDGDIPAGDCCGEVLVGEEDVVEVDIAVVDSVGPAPCT